MGRMTETFDGIVGSLPDRWEVAEFEVRLRAIPGHLRTYADDKLANFTLLAGATRYAAGRYRFRISHLDGAGLPDPFQAGRGLAALDASNEGDELVLLGV